MSQPALTREEEEQWVSEEKARQRRRRYIRWGIAGCVFLIVAAFVVHKVTGLGATVVSPSSTIDSQSTTGVWLMGQGNIQHTGMVPGSAFPAKGIPKWKFESQRPLLTSPVFAKSKVFVATGENKLVALEEATGSVAWTYRFQSRVTSSSPAIAHEILFVGTHDRMLHALDINSGDLKWSYDMGGQIFGSPTVVKGSLYFGSTNGHLYSLDARTGKLLWKSQRTYTNRAVERITSSPTINQGILVAGSYDENLHILDSASGEKRYLLQIGEYIKNAITVVEDYAYFTTSSGLVVAVDYTKRNFPFQKGIWAIWRQLAIWEFAPRPPHPPGVVWVRETDGPVQRNLATDGRRLFVATATGTLSALDTKTGELLWTVEDLAPIMSSPIISGDAVIQATVNGTIYGFNTGSGEQRWKFSIGETVTASPILANGILYIPTVEGSLYALQ